MQIVAKSTVVHRSKKAAPKPKAGLRGSDVKVTHSGPYSVHWVFTDPAKAKKTGTSSSKGSVISRRSKDASGKWVVYRFVDANSASFGSDFDNVFRSNVRKARRENKQVVGVPDRGVKS